MQYVKLIVALLLMPVLVVAIFFAIQADKNDSNSKQSTSSSSSNKPDETTKSGELVTKSGVFGCLTSKDTSGPQTMECAFGLTDDDGNSYALSSNDPMLIGTIPTSDRIEVMGYLTNPSETTKYKIEGSISVESVKKL